MTISRSNSSFNGATTLGSWKTRDAARPSGNAASQLQWGHDAGVVEDPGGSGDATQLTALQWGHDAGVVEDRSGRRSGPSAALQWGHDAGVVEDTRRIGRARVRTARGFNGATTLGSWKTRARRRDGASALARFNGATTLGSWKTPRRRRGAGRPVLQWGHDAGVVEDVR